MIELEQEAFTKDRGDEKKSIVQEYEVVVDTLLRDLETCKLSTGIEDPCLNTRVEQTRLKAEVESLRRESKAAAEFARESFSHTNLEQCAEHQDCQESLENLQKRISIMEKEKEAVFQLWQISLKAVDTLEEELKATHKDGRAVKYYEEQVNAVKETYTEAIKALEAKLVQTKENFTKHQSLWETNREKIEILGREKSELEKKLMTFQIESRSKEQSSERTIETLKTKLEASQRDLEISRSEKSELRERLQEARIFTTKVVAQDEESKRKILEAIEMVETSVKEKEEALQREARALQERANLEVRLNSIVEDYTTRLDKELTSAKENLVRSTKKYVLEIKELKAELREKVTLLDRAQRENRLVEEELEKVRHGSEDFLQRSSANVLDLEQKLKEAYFKLETCEENSRKKYEVKIRLAEERIADMETRLAASEDRVRRTQTRSSKECDDRIREAEERTKEVLERYSGLERRLARTLDERENLASELRTLQTTYDREIARRSHERQSQETRVRELQDELQTTNNSLEKANARAFQLSKQIESLQNESRNKTIGDEQQISNLELMLRLKSLQEKFEQRTRELSEHVEIHQKLCRKWKDEAKSLTTKFQMRSKELREKVNILRKENDELNKELLTCRQHLAQLRVQSLHGYDQGDAAR